MAFPTHPFWKFSRNKQVKVGCNNCSVRKPSKHLLTIVYSCHKVWNNFIRHTWMCVLSVYFSVYLVVILSVYLYTIHISIHVSCLFFNLCMVCISISFFISLNARCLYKLISKFQQRCEADVCYISNEVDVIFLLIPT